MGHDLNKPATLPALPDAGVATALLAWFAAQARDLPWRHTTDPYAIWVSEIMLQQTQVSTVIPYYERFLARFPQVAALAQASLDEILALWQGLGYYARARSMHQAAQSVLRDHAGQLPNTYRALRALPGIGDYTAGAILSIAYGQDLPAVDGNVTRVLCRLCDYAGDPTQPGARRALRAVAERLLPHGHAGAFNQALMELGATICLPREPACAACPVAAFCQAYRSGTQKLRPFSPGRPPLPQRTFVAAFITCKGRLLIVRRKPHGLLGGLWELPQGEALAQEEQTVTLERLLRERLGIAARVAAPAAVIQHAYTHFRLTVHLHPCALPDTACAVALQADDQVWDAVHWLAPAELPAYGLTGVTTRALARTHWPDSNEQVLQGSLF